MNHKKMLWGFIITLLAIPAYLIGGTPSIILTIVSLITGIKIMADAFEHYPDQ